MIINNTAIKLSKITKKYYIHHDKPTLIEKFISSKNEVYTALSNINLTIKKGEKVGIIGLNGSGKTTLLKIIAGITSPSIGTVEISGNLVSLIDLESGFNPELSGYQNIFLNALLIGMSKQLINQKIKNIINFADIKQFIYAPFFTYSQGMKLRLGFSIAVHSNLDIMVLDEGLGVGDIKFQKKSMEKLNEIFLSGKTILFVSHMTEVIRKNCKRVIVMNEGKIIADGKTDIVLNNYLNHV